MKRMILGRPTTDQQHNFYVSEDQIVTETIQDCTQIVKHNKEMKNSASRNSKANGFLGASVPIVLYQKWKKEWREKHSKNWDWMTYAVMKINSRDYSELRTSDMKI